MRHLGPIAATAALLAASPALAAASRTFVSGHGSDANPCTLAAPCRSLQQAVNSTSAGGEVTILDPAGYGPAGIFQAISIVNDGVGEAALTAPSGDNALGIGAGPSDVINLRGLTLVGNGVGRVGIDVFGAGAVNIQNCTIRSFTYAGLLYEPNSAANLSVSDTVSSDNGEYGFALHPTNLEGATLTATFERTQAYDNPIGGYYLFGGDAAGFMSVTIADSIATGSTVDGSSGFSAVDGPTLMLVDSVASFNNTGVASAGGTVIMSGVTMFGNVYGNNPFAYFATAGGFSTIGLYPSNYVIDTTRTSSTPEQPQ